MWNRLIALALTLPMTITIATAQAAQDADIQAYSQDLSMRIARGRQSGQLTQSNYNSLQSLYNQVEMIRRSIGNRPMNMMVRTNMMNSLTNLDKQLTTYLHDDINSRYQMWDPSKRSWRNNWWMADRSQANSFNDEIDAYQNSLRARIDRGRASGQITRSELSQLTTAYDNIDRAQQQYRIGGFSTYERNSLMTMLTQLDRDITAQLQDSENSHYRHWNPNGRSWNNNWWKNTSSSAPSFPTSSTPARDVNDGRGNWGRTTEGDNHGSWNRNESNTRGDWNRGENNDHGNWNRGDANRTEPARSDSNRDWNRAGSNAGDWNNRNGFNRDQRSDSLNRSGSGSTIYGGTTSPNTGIVPPTVNNPPQGHTQPQANTPASTGTAPATGAGNPSAGSGAPGSGTSGDGRRGSWGSRSGDASGDRTGGGTRTPQN